MRVVAGSRFRRSRVACDATGGSDLEAVAESGNNGTPRKTALHSTGLCVGRLDLRTAQFGRLARRVL